MASRIIARAAVRRPWLPPAVRLVSGTATTATTATTAMTTAQIETQTQTQTQTQPTSPLPPSPPPPQTEPPDKKPRKKKRFPKYLRDSPNATLALRLKSRSEVLTFEAWQRFEAVARSPSLRLPVVTMQMLLRADEARASTSLSESLCSEARWQAKLAKLAYKGISEADIRQWVWILEGRDGDERVARFLSTEEGNGGDRPKPLFLLFQLLRRDETISKGSSLAGLYRYILRHHVQTREQPQPRPGMDDDGGSGGGREEEPARPPFGARRRSLDPGSHMSPDQFATTLGLLVFHYRRVWPAALPAVARLASAYVETVLALAQRVPADDRTSAQAQAYADACRLFNIGLTLFQGKAAVKPVASMRYNWQAQRELLRMSAGVMASVVVNKEDAKPLLINRDGFRAIRRVLVALGKTYDERHTALRMARTWPPYRRVFDGLDEQRGPGDTTSRSVQAGVLMREAGYGETEHDRALGILGGGGGATTTTAPTVQTRSLSPRTWRGRKASLNVFATWAARVKATRDVNEAWHEFQTAPATTTTGPTLRPNAPVYAELFKKLLAAPVDDHLVTAPGPAALPRLVPGDAREVYAVHDATLTALEKQRLRPPDVAALYAQMLRDNCRPVGDCLVTLVHHAATVAIGLQYLRDSPLDHRAVEALRVSDRRQIKAEDIDYATLRGIPLPVLNAYVHLLCRFQPRRTAEPARLGKLQRIALVHHAIHLCAVRLPATDPAGRGYKAPWHTIVRTLARPRLLVAAGEDDRAYAQARHDAEALALALRVVGRVQQQAGVDVVLFEALAQATLKVLEGDGGSGPGPGPDRLFAELDVLRQAHVTLAAAFREMTERPVHVAHHPSTPYALTARHLELYVGVLGYAGDGPGLVAVLRWALGVWDDAAVLEDAKDPEHRQHRALGRVFAAVRAFTEGVADEAVDGELLELQAQLDEMRKQRGCTWQWATSEEADAYVEWHRQAHNAAFWDRVRPGVEGEL